MPFNRLLIIDDEPDVAATVGRIARRAGFDTIVTTEGPDFLDRALTWSPTVIVLDLSMPDLDGLAILRELAGQGSAAHIMIVSGHDRPAIDHAKAYGEELGLSIVGILQKPLRVEALRAALRTIFDDNELISSHEALQAIRDGAFFLEFQPIVRLSDTRRIGVEALARWNHDRRGVLFPDSFIPTIESAGLMKDFTPMVIDLAVAQSRVWADSGEPMRMSLNVSGACVGALALDDIIAGACARQGVNPATLTVEITETAAMGDIGRAAVCMGKLKALGVRISVDDFGTGHSSLVQLHRLPLSEIKIDKSFVFGCEVNRESQIIVRTIINLARSLSLEVVAEGIETEAARDFIVDMGCGVGQGYLFSRPLQADRVLSWRPPPELA